MKNAVLLLADGRVFEGSAFGAEGETIGEVCFKTSAWNGNADIAAALGATRRHWLSIARVTG